jgi:hypothetical protein
MFPPLSPEAAKHSFARAIAKTHQQPWTQRISVVVERASKKPIGIASIKMIDTQNRIAEVGMLLARSARAKHYASESSQVLITSIFRRHTVATICTQIPDGHKLAESWVSDLGYARAQDIAPEAVRAPFVRWALSRDTWADTYK